MTPDPYASKVLKPDVHERLVADIGNYARDAGIQPKHIWEPLTPKVSPAELTWVKRFRFHTSEGHSGLCLEGASLVFSVEDRMAAIAGALVRNFIRARVFTLSQLFAEAESEGMPKATCLLIPNFFNGKNTGKAIAGPIAPWRVSLVLDILMERHLSGLQTVLYVESILDLEEAYGPPIAKHLKTHFTIVGV